MGISSGLALGLVIIPILAVLIIIHELGHFFAARSVGVKVEEFGIGIPPRAKGWRWKGVLWSLNWIPFGGFVRVKGEDGSDLSPDSMNAKGPWQRAFFLAAGPAMNFVAAIVLCIVMVGFQGVTNTTESVYVNTVSENSPAQVAGWQPGDVIVAIDGQGVDSVDALSSSIASNLDRATSVTIRRGSQTIETSVVPRSNPPANEGATGIQIAAGRQSIVHISEVSPGSPAANAGFLEGDEIVAVDGIPVESSAQATLLLDQVVDQVVILTVDRDGQRSDLSVQIPPRALVLTSVAADSPASKALLYARDQIVSIGETSIRTGDEVFGALRAASGATIEVTYLREGRMGSVDLLVPQFGDDQNPLTIVGINIGVENSYAAMGVDGIVTPVYERVSAARAIPEGWNQFAEFMSVTFDGLQRMATEGVDRDEIAGPVGMGQATSELLSESVVPVWFTITFIMVIISVGLGVMNLLPIPALDGGRLLFVFIEILRGGKRISPEKEGLVHLVGMVFLLGLMFLVAFGDVTRLLDGRSMMP